MRTWCVLVCVLWLGWWAPTALAQVATLEPPAPQLGERARLRLVEAPADSTLLPRGLDVVLRATGDPQVFEVIVARVGDVAIALPATGDTLRWTVHPQLAQATPDSLRPWVRVGALGPNWWPTAALVAAIVGPLAWWLWRHRRRAAALELVLVEPPHVIALRRLDALAARSLLAAGRFDEFYVEASHTLRAYVSGRFGVPALDWTTEEALDRLLAAGHEPRTVAPIDPLLRAADVVKFAAQRPSEHQAQQWLSRAREWIEATAVQPVYSPPEAMRAAAQWQDRSDHDDLRSAGGSR